MSKHNDDTCPYLVRASLLESENALLRNLGIKLESMIDPLKAEVEELTFNPSHYINDSGEWVAPANFYRVRDRLIDQQNEVARLKAEVERLRKAGDAMAFALILFEMKSEEEREERIKAWSAAKEGKPSV